MTSEEYIIKLLQTIEMLHSTLLSLKEEIAFLRERVAKMDASSAEQEQERRRLMSLIEAKDDDNRRMAQQISELLAKVDSLTKALEDKYCRKRWRSLQG